MIFSKAALIETMYIVKDLFILLFK